MKKYTILLITIATTSSYADIHKCIDKNKKVHYQDQVCTYSKGKLDAYQPTGQYESRDPIEVQNEISDLKDRANSSTDYGYSYPRYETNDPMANERRKEQDRQKSWNDLGPVGLTYNKSPSTYYNTQFRH